MAQETISPEMGLTAAPSQGFSERAGTCSLHLAILQQTTYCTGRAGPGHCAATGGVAPPPGQSSATQVSVPGLKPSDSIGQIFLLGMKDNSPIFEPFFCQFYKIACNFINIFKRYSFVNI